MAPRGTTLVAGLGMGLLLATAAAAGASAVEADHAATASRLGPGERFYRVNIRYTGSLTTVQAGSGQARDVREESGGYRVRSKGPIRLTAHCTGNHLTLHPRSEPEREFLKDLRRMRGSSCKAVRRLAQREFRAAAFRRARTVFPKRFWRQFNRTAREVYEFDRTRAVSMTGLLTGGKLTRTEEPIARSTGPCQPPAQITTRTQTDAQLVSVDLLSGSLDNGRRMAGRIALPITPFTKTTTQSGIRLRSAPVGKSGFRTEVNEIFCPRSDGAFDKVGGDDFSGSRTLLPLDSSSLIERLGSKRDVKLLEHGLAFSSMEAVRPARSKLGGLIRVRVDVSRTPRQPPSVTRTPSVVVHRHNYVLTFKPCPNGGTVRTCPAS